MNQEPSLLDYLKSLLDPRREPLALPVPEAEPGEAVEAAPAEDPTVAVETDPAAQVEQAAAAAVPMQKAAAEPVPAVELPPPASEPRGPFPWRTILALVLALVAQSALEPPDRSLNTGVGLYLAAFVLGLWAFWTGELRLPDLPPARWQPDDLSVRRGAIYAALPAVAFAFIVLGGNRFTAFNLTVWFGALALLCYAFYRSGGLPPDGWARLKPPYRFTVTGWTVIVVLVAGIVLFYRFYRLEEVPSQMFSDHAEKLQDVQEVLNGQTQIFFPRNTGREFVQMYLTAFTADVLGYDLSFMALKMGTALAGLVTLPFIYLLGVELANRRVGLLAVLLAGASYWLNVITRVALRFSLYPLFVAPVLYYIVRGLRHGRRNDFIWAGIFLGLGLHGYSPYRFVPILVGLLVLLFVLHAGADAKRRQAFWHLGVVVAVSFVVFLPLLRFMAESEANRSIVLYRSLTRIGTVEAEYQAHPLIVLADNMWRAMTMFAWENGNTWVHSVVFRPALDVVSAALFYLGYILLFVRYLRRRAWEDAALLVSVPFLILPSAMSLAFPSENPSLNRTGGAIIPVFLIAALMLDSIAASLRRWAGADWGRIAAWTATAFLLAWSLAQNYDLVFRQYDQQFRQSAWNTTELGSVIRGFADSVGSEDTAWVIPWPHWVDTRLVGINAGVYIRDYAIGREQLAGTAEIPGPKLYLFNPQDAETLQTLEQLFPSGRAETYISEIPGKDFIVFLAP